MSLHQDIFDQPVVLRNLLDDWELTAEIAAQIRLRDIKFIYLVARGTSDNAGLYAQYLFGSANGLAVAQATPSLFTMYHQPPRLKNALVIGISQSGESADLLEVMDYSRREGAATLAITNSKTSPLAERAEFVIDVKAGPESVAATKTYTSELTAIAMLSTALRVDKRRQEELSLVPDHISEMLRLDGSIYTQAERYRYMEQCVVLGRGFNYATAYELALKLKEMAYVIAESFSPADFQHGPITIIEQGFPVIAILPKGAVLEAVVDLLKHLFHERRAELLVISNEPQALELARTPIPLPHRMPEWLSPIVSIVPGQLFTYHLARAKGLDPEHPRGLYKVTKTY